MADGQRSKPGRLECGGSGGLPREYPSPRHLGGGTTGRLPAVIPNHRGRQDQPLMIVLLMYHSRRVGQQDKVTRKETNKAAWLGAPPLRQPPPTSGGRSRSKLQSVSFSHTSSL